MNCTAPDIDADGMQYGFGQLVIRFKQRLEPPVKAVSVRSHEFIRTCLHGHCFRKWKFQLLCGQRWGHYGKVGGIGCASSQRLEI